MREILFRGKRADNGEWSYGNYCKAEMNNHGGDEHFIIEYSCDGSQHSVDPETVGQYTGMTDRNGVKVFEGDIVHIHDTLLQCTKPWHEFDGYVDFMDGSYRIVSGATTHYRWVDYEVEVIGNIHDNPELLKGGRPYSPRL